MRDAGFTCVVDAKLRGSRILAAVYSGLVVGVTRLSNAGTVVGLVRLRHATEAILDD
jgi:hypothetical protein